MLQAQKVIPEAQKEGEKRVKQPGAVLWDQAERFKVS